MTIYNIYIFDKSGNLLYYHEWNRFKQSGMTREEVEFLLFFNMYFQSRVLLISGSKINVWYAIFHQVIC